MRVLIVEDELPLAQAVARGLRTEGMAVDIALDGGEALAKAAVCPYEVIVLDRDLPVVHGDKLPADLVAVHHWQITVQHDHLVRADRRLG